MNNTKRHGSILLGMFAAALVSLLTWMIYASRMDVHGASQRGELERVKSILAKRAELVNARDELGRPPMIYAVMADQKAVVEYLIAKGADPGGRDNLGQTPLHWAAMYGHKQIIKTLTSVGADANAKDNDGETPLYEALYWGREILKLLVSNGAEISNNLLHAAAGSDYKDAVEFLIMQGARVNTRDETGGTPLHGAAFCGHQDVVELLIAKGAEVDAKDFNGITPLHMAAFESRTEIMELLIENGGNINAKDADGRTPHDYEAIGQVRIESERIGLKHRLLEVLN